MVAFSAFVLLPPQSGLFPLLGMIAGGFALLWSVGWIAEARSGQDRWGRIAWSAVGLWAALLFLRGQRDPLWLFVLPALYASVAWLLGFYNQYLREQRNQRWADHGYVPPTNIWRKPPSARIELIRFIAGAGLLITAMVAVPSLLVPRLDAGYPVGLYLPTAVWTAEKGDQEWNYKLTQAVLTLEELKLTVQATNLMAHHAALGVALSRSVGMLGRRTRLTRNDQPALNFPVYPSVIEGLAADTTVQIGPGEARTVVLSFSRPDNVTKHPWHLDLFLFYRTNLKAPTKGAECGFDFDLRFGPSQPLPEAD